MRSEKAREAQRLYIKEWRKKNPEKVRAIQERYWENRLARMKAASNETVIDSIKEEGE